LVSTGARASAVSGVGPLNFARSLLLFRGM
jgi:hypothetical protein